MAGPRKHPSLGALIFFSVAFAAGSYFTFAAVEGDHGIFRHIEVNAQVATLTRQRDALQAQYAAMKNKTRRLSDKYLDLDLLSQQARDVLGMMRPDEILIR